jgi:branched-chain amino acid transport system substrate-binding protein
VASSSQPYFPLGDYAARTLGYKRVAIIADDFAYGYETAGGFQRGFEDAGGKIVQKLWPPLNVADYGSYIVQIKTDVDAIWVGFAGANGLRFLKQYKDYGMKIPVLGSMTSTDEGILRRMGDEALGVVTSGWYAAGLESPENDAFVAAVNKEYGADPGYYTLGCYSAGALVEAAARAIGGKVEDKVALMKALRNPGTVKDARGEWRIDEFGNPVMPIYIRKVERKNGKLVNAVVKTYPGVSQFWTYDPKQYIANPSYSRDYPPAKFLGQ